MPGIDDERLLFYLRHADEIRAWAAIEKEVQTAVRGILSDLGPTIEERLAAVDPAVAVSRWDANGYERIRAHRTDWPGGIGVVIEWSGRPDPGSASGAPKLGVLWTGETRIARDAFATEAVADGLLRLGYDQRESVWPLRRVHATPDWWQDVDAWTGGLVGAIAELWSLAAPLIDRSLRPAATL